MLYKGYFKSLKEKLYCVEIQTGTNNTPANGELTLSSNPFTTTMDTASDIIYVPVKYQSAQTEIVNNEYLFSLYSSTAKQNRVRLLDASNNVLFVGYTSPNIWDNDYNFITETYSVEILDGLTILQYYDYTKIGSVKDFRTFAEIINHILTTSGCYNDWYWSTNTTISGVNGYLPNQLTISEQCFFDEDDEPMKMNAVLEEICKFCGVTAYADGTSVYFIDYAAVGTGGYVHYNIGSTTATGTTTLTDSHEIVSTDYAKTGSNLSLKGTYSKVTVTDSLYAVESILPELFKDEDLVNVEFTTGREQRWAYEFFYDNLPEYQKKFFKVKMRSYRNKNFNYYYYDSSTGNIRTDTRPLGFEGYTSHAWNGAALTRYNVAFGDSSVEAAMNMKYDDWSEYLMLSNNFQNYDLKVMESNDEFIKPFFISTDAKIVYSGSLIWTNTQKVKNQGNQYVNWPYFPSTDMDSEDVNDVYNVSTTQMTILPKNITLKCGISLGNYSAIDASTWGSGTNNTLTIPFCDRSLKDSSSNDDVLIEGRAWGWLEKKKHDIFYREHDILNNVMYWDNIKEEGFCVSLSGISNETTVIGAKPKLSFYAPTNTIWISESYHPSRAINVVAACFIKDFDVKAVIPFEGGKDENDTDTEYSYVIDSEYVNELSDIEFKICTYDGKQLNYSAVAYPYNGNYKFLDKMYNAGLSLSERAENILCYRIAEQYHNPVKVLKLNLFDDYKLYSTVHESVLDINCMVDSISHDYKYDSVEITLEEIK